MYVASLQRLAPDSEGGAHVATSVGRLLVEDALEVCIDWGALFDIETMAKYFPHSRPCLSKEPSQMDPFFFFQFIREFTQA